jgi:hypothetical protein
MEGKAFVLNALPFLTLLRKENVLAGARVACLVGAAERPAVDLLQVLYPECTWECPAEPCGADVTLEICADGEGWKDVRPRLSMYMSSSFAYYKYLNSGWQREWNDEGVYCKYKARDALMCLLGRPPTPEEVASVVERPGLPALDWLALELPALPSSDMSVPQYLALALLVALAMLLAYLKTTPPG